MSVTSLAVDASPDKYLVILIVMISQLGLTFLILITSEFIILCSVGDNE